MTISFWDLVIDRISRRLDGWKKAHLSLGGRITLIQSCLSHIPTVFPFSFQDPIINSFKSRKVIEGFSMVWVWGRKERSFG